MNKIKLSLLFALISFQSIGQQFQDQIICSVDTVVVTVDTQREYIKVPGDTSYSYRAVLCTKRANAGFGFGMGGLKCSYNSATSEWLGTHGGVFVNFFIPINRFSLGFNMILATANQRKELVYNKDTIRTTAQVNPSKLEYYLGYSVNFKYNFSLEPFLGISKSIFYVKDTLYSKKEFSPPSIMGFFGGASIKKYFRFEEYVWLTLFTSVGYSVTDYRKINKDLGIGYYEWVIGAGFKQYLTRKFHKRIS